VIWTLAWKEWREQQNILIAMAILGAMFIVGLASALAKPATGLLDEVDAAIVFAAALIAAGIYGLACGSALLAGEAEEGTLVFLDRLAGERGRVFRTKLGTGLGLTLGYAALLAAILALTPNFRTLHLLPTAMVFPVALEALAWGLLASALWRNALGAAGCGVALWLASCAVTALILAGIDAPSMNQDARTVPIFIIRAVLDGGAVLVAYRVFCRPDRERREPRSSALGRLRRWRPVGLPALTWLTFRQAGLAVLILYPLAFIVAMIPPVVGGLVLWPLVMTLFGVWCGVSVFGGEQAAAAGRFLGDQRLPPGRIWLVKNVLWLAIGAGLMVCMYVGVACQDFFRHPMTANSKGLFELDSPLLYSHLRIGNALGLFLSFGFFFGFAVGELASLVTPKTIVAAVVAVFVSLGMVGLWLSPFIGGGVEWWQVLAVPAILLAAVRFTIWAWSGERLLSGKPLAALGVFALLAAGFTAAYFQRRATEVPDIGEPYDVAAFVANLPKGEANRAAELLLQADRDLGEQERKIDAEMGRPVKPLFPAAEKPKEAVKPTETAVGPAAGPAAGAGAGAAAGVSAGSEEPEPSFRHQLYKVPERGWPDGETQLGRWLDRIFEGNWYQEVRDGVALPPGVLVTAENYWDFRRFPHHLVNADYLLGARALQLQARGQLDASWEVLSLGLAISRHYRTHAFLHGYMAGSRMEAGILLAMDQWGPKLSGNAAVLRKALAGLQQHEANTPPIADAVKMDYLWLRRAVDDPAVWLAHDQRIMHAPQLEVESYVAAACLQLPWERARLGRAVRFYSAGLLRTATTDFPHVREATTAESYGGSDYWLFANNFWLSPITGSGTETEVRRLSHVVKNSMLREILRGMSWFTMTPAFVCQLRATELKLALWLFQMEEKRPANSLDELVPKYLKSLPIDPFSGSSFHYRLANPVNSPDQLVLMYLNPMPGGNAFGSSTFLPYSYHWRQSEGAFIYYDRNVPANERQGVQRYVPVGTGVLWSVGIDGIDNGGIVQGGWRTRFDTQIWKEERSDWIFLVPQLQLTNP
jgi:hypothetical protein